MTPLSRAWSVPLWALALLSIGQLAWAADSSDKARINQARAQADAKLAAQEAECQQRFAVTDCVLAAREQHRAVVGPLRRDLLALDERERKQRAAERLERLRDKAESARNAASAPVGSAAPSTASEPVTTVAPIRPRLRLPESAGASQPGAEAAAPAASAPTASRPARQPAKRLTPAPDPNAAQRAADREREAEAHRASVLKRNAERSAKKPPAAPLPVPGAASSGAR